MTTLQYTVEFAPDYSEHGFFLDMIDAGLNVNDVAYNQDETVCLVEMPEDEALLFEAACEKSPSIEIYHAMLTA